jgi:hypothetical protein
VSQRAVAVATIKLLVNAVTALVCLIVPLLRCMVVFHSYRAWETQGGALTEFSR